MTQSYCLFSCGVSVLRVQGESPGATEPAAETGAQPESAQPESESSWGELQDAGGEEEEDGEEKADADGDGGGGDAEPAHGSAEPAASAEEKQDDTSPLGVDGIAAGAGEEGLAREAGAAVTVAAADHTVGGDVVMVSPRGRASENGLEAVGGAGRGEGEEEVEDGHGAAGGDVGRRPNLGALMTMLVVSLRMQRLVHWVVRKRCLDGLSEENLIDLLAALEVMTRFMELSEGGAGGGTELCVVGVVCFCLRGGAVELCGSDACWRRIQLVPIVESSLYCCISHSPGTADYAVECGVLAPPRLVAAFAVCPRSGNLLRSTWDTPLAQRHLLPCIISVLRGRRPPA